MFMKVVQVILLFGVLCLVCCVGGSDEDNAERLETDSHEVDERERQGTERGSAEPPLFELQRSGNKQDAISVKRDVLPAAGSEDEDKSISESGIAPYPKETDRRTGGMPEHLPCPGDVQLQFVNTSSILITWSYQFANVVPWQFIVQCSHNGDPYTNCSNLLNSTHYVYSGMEYAGYYQFRVLAYHLGLTSKPTETDYFVNGITAPPGPPSSVMVRAVSYSEINLQWEGPTTPTPLLYIIEWGTEASSLDMVEDVYQSTHTTFTDLAPGKTYYFQVIADISGRLSIPTPIVNATTHSSDLPPVQLQQDFIVSSSWVYLSWSSPPSHRYPLAVTNFTVYYTKQHEALKLSNELSKNMFRFHWIVAGDWLDANVTDLDPATCYVFCVGYSSGDFLSSLSLPLELLTLDGITCYCCEPLSSTELLVKWKYFGSSDTESNVHTFLVQELPDDTLKRITVAQNMVNSSDHYTYVVSGLRPWTSHTVLIALDNSTVVYDQCPTTECVTEEDAPYEPPANITFTEVTAHAITLTWLAPPIGAQNGNIQDYAIMYTCTSQCSLQTCNSTKWVVVPADSNRMKSKILNLMPFTEYTFEIAARTSRGGYGPFSFKMSAKTDEGAPGGSPDGIVLADVTDRSLALSWDPPNPCLQNGNITGYTVCISEYTQHHIVGGQDPLVLIFNVSETEVTVSPLKPATAYAILIAAHTRAGCGPYSPPLQVSTMDSVINKTVNMNFTVTVVEANSSNCSYFVCFSWAPVFASTDNPTVLPFGSTTILNWEYCILYTTSGDRRTETGSVFSPQPNAEITHYELLFYSNNGSFTPGIIYSFWLSVEANLSNGTRLYLQSHAVPCTIPLCTLDTGEPAVRLKVSIIITAVTAVLIVVGVVPLLAACMHKWLKKKCTPITTMEGYPSWEVEPNDYVMSSNIMADNGKEIESEEDSSVADGSAQGSRLSHNAGNIDRQTCHLCAVDKIGVWPEDKSDDTLCTSESLHQCREQIIGVSRRQSPDGCSLSTASSLSSLLQSDGT